MSEGCVCVCSTVEAVLGFNMLYVFYKNCVNMNVGGVNNRT